MTEEKKMNNAEQLNKDELSKEELSEEKLDEVAGGMLPYVLKTDFIPRGLVEDGGKRLIVVA